MNVIHIYVVMSLLSPLSELNPLKVWQCSQMHPHILFFLQTTAGYADISTVSQCCILLTPYYDDFLFVETILYCVNTYTILVLAVTKFICNSSNPKTRMKNTFAIKIKHYLCLASFLMNCK